MLRGCPSHRFRAEEACGRSRFTLALKQTLGFPSGLCRKGFFQTSLDSVGSCISETVHYFLETV